MYKEVKSLINFIPYIVNSDINELKYIINHKNYKIQLIFTGYSLTEKTCSIAIRQIENKEDFQYWKIDETLYNEMVFKTKINKL